MNAAELDFVYPSIQIGHVLVHVFSVMLGVGIISLMVVTLVRSKGCGLKKSMAGGAVGAGLVVGFAAVGCHSDGPNLHLGCCEGAVGWIAAAIGVIAWAAVRHANLRRLADCLAPGLALFLMVIGTADFLAGSNFGRPTDSSVGVTFTNGLALAWYHTPLDTPLQPTQWYESALAGGIFVFLIAWERRRPPEGTLFLAFAVIYAVGRFLLEFLRGDAGRGFLWRLSITQWFCLATLAAIAVSTLYAWAQQRVPGWLPHIRGLHYHRRHSTQRH